MKPFHRSPMVAGLSAALLWIGHGPADRAEGREPPGRPTAVPVRTPHEVRLEASGRHENPYVDLHAEAVLTGPDGMQVEVPLFWDGGDAWAFRFAPGRPGDWTWVVRGPDPGLDGASGSFRAEESDAPGSIRPMSGAPSHFEREDGTSFWFMGDTAWALFTDIPGEGHDREAVERYLDRRASQGINVVHAMLLSEGGDGNHGGPPFDDLAAGRINPGYWREVDERIASANGRGMVVGLALAWGEKTGREPFAWNRFADLEARERYARYVAARYGAFDVYFIVAGEWHGEVRARSDQAPEAVRREFLDLGDALSRADPHGRMAAIHPMTRHGSTREFAGADWMTFADYQQNYHRLHDRVLLSRHLGRPVVNSEYAYYLRDGSGDGRNDKENSFTADDMRFASWDVAMAGGYFVTGFGTTYFGGRRDPGPFDVEAEKNRDWEDQLGHIRAFFEGLEWWRLAPADLLLASDAPRGEDRSQRVERGNRGAMTVPRPPEATYWALARPGETYVIYVRGLEAPVRLSLEATGGPFRARQFDPRAGSFEDLGRQDLGDRFEFRPPDDRDWIVLLERDG